jgi:NADPH:quinone reductase-like Zn-dependent oxidoreductase
VEQAQIHPIVDRVFEFSELPAALRQMQAAAHFGKLVIAID